ncbi:MAG: serine/threonine-protein kinase [Sandaracinaceae bacterium]
MSEQLGKCGRYTLLRRIGAGGMGEIFLARDAAGEQVAIKRLLSEGAKDPVFVGMFLDEARLVERLDHPHVCRVFEHGMEGFHYFLAMEFIDGKTLLELLEQHGPLPVPVACRILADLASALDYAHRFEGEDGPLGIVHRDATPANVMVDRDGKVKLLDFGLAKARTQLMRTAPGLVKGKFGYLAPEQLAGQVDWRTDVFALGLCLYEALTARALFNQKTAAETVRAIRSFSGPPALSGRVAGVTPALDGVLARALYPRASDRFESAAAFRAALAEVVREVGSPARSADLARLVTGELPPPPEPEVPDEVPASPAFPRWILGAVAVLACLGSVAALVASYLL